MRSIVRKSFGGRSAMLAGAGLLAVATALPAQAQSTTDTPNSKSQVECQAVNADGTCADNAAANTNPVQGQAIIVTGSRLGQAAVTTQPTQSITGDTISNLGYTNIGKALTELPSFGVPGNSPAGPQGSFGAGQTFVNLYDLGAQRTLSLVNGNRFVSSGSSSIFGSVQGSPVDLGQIAPDLVERIDVVSVGGAPIYGSDAIAGTVNVILKKDYEGLSLSGSYGLAQQGDAPDYNVSLLAGKNFDGGRGNITLNVYYDNQTGLATSARRFTDGNRIFNGTDPSGAYTYARFSGGLHYTPFTNTGFPLLIDDIPIYKGSPYAAVTNAAGQPLYFGQNGQLQQFHDGIPLKNGITDAGGDGFAIGNYGNLLANNNRIQGTLLANYEFSNHLRFHGEFWIGRSKASNISDQPFYNTALFANAGETNGDLIFSTDNPFLTAADQQTIKNSLAANGLPTDTFYLSRANTDLATGAFTTNTDLYRGVAGLDGDFSVGSHNFTWEATFNYGRTDSSTSSNEIVTQNYNNALNAVLDASGNIVCAPGYTSSPFPTYSSSCAALDVFGYRNESQAAIDYITAPAVTKQVDTQLDFVADVKGDVVHLPAGDVQFVLGYEHRRESQSFDPGAFYRGELQQDGSYVQYGNSIPITGVSGAYHTNEGFGEINIPLVSSDMNVPLIHSLELHGAARYTNNSISGGFWSYTGGATYAPVSFLTLRGNYTRSFRSPAVTELFAPIASVYETANDPCDARYIGDGPNPTQRAANCSAAGLPANFQSNIVDYTAKGASGGNPNLENELAKSWTVGAVFAPHFIPRLRVSADYVSINISNEIASPGLTSLLNACYDSSTYPTTPACSTFTRDSSGQITSFLDSYANIALENFRALQASVNYTLPLESVGLPESAGALNVSANWLHTYRHYYKVGSDDVTYVLSGLSDPKDAVQGNIDWATKGFDWLWQVSYYGPTQVDPNAGAGTYEFPRISPYWMVNTSIGIKANDHFQLRLMVNNVFNLGIPSPYTSYSSNKYFDALMGRYFRVNAKITF